MNRRELFRCVPGGLACAAMVVMPAIARSSPVSCSSLVRKIERKINGLRDGSVVREGSVYHAWIEDLTREEYELSLRYRRFVNSTPVGKAGAGHVGIGWTIEVPRWFDGGPMRYSLNVVIGVNPLRDIPRYCNQFGDKEVNFYSI